MRQEKIMIKQLVENYTLNRLQGNLCVCVYTMTVCALEWDLEI